MLSFFLCFPGVASELECVSESCLLQLGKQVGKQALHCYFDKSMKCTGSESCKIDNRPCIANRAYFDHAFRNKEDTNNAIHIQPFIFDGINPWLFSTSKRNNNESRERQSREKLVNSNTTPGAILSKAMHEIVLYMELFSLTLALIKIFVINTFIETINGTNFKKLYPHIKIHFYYIKLLLHRTSIETQLHIGDIMNLWKPALLRN